MPKGKVKFDQSENELTIKEFLSLMIGIIFLIFKIYLTFKINYI